MDIDTFQTKLKDITTWLTKEFTGVRTGQASPALLDAIRAESYGAMTPLNQMCSISIEDARTLRLSAWDASVVPSIERAITEANLGVSVATDSAGLRVIFPELTSERREQLLKLAKAKLEEARVSVRSQRDDIMKSLDKQQKDGDITEDDKFTLREQVQKNVDASNTSLEQLYNQKEVELKK